MLQKLKNKKGFTLMEMLIVVAIIAVLVAIAIPTFSGALTKAKEATDVANIRAAYADWQIAVLSDGTAIPTAQGTEGSNTATDFTSKLVKLNYFADKFTYTYDNSKGVGTIKYEAAKLTANDGTHVFTWTLDPLDIK